jgi:hypothetical protein
MIFYSIKQKLPRPNSKVYLKIENIHTYEAGYIYDGTNFRRCVFEIGEIVPTDKILYWAYDVSNIWHNSSEEQPDGKHVVVAYNTECNTGMVAHFISIKPNYRWAYLEDLDYEFKEDKLTSDSNEL